MKNGVESNSINNRERKSLLPSRQRGFSRRIPLVIIALLAIVAMLLLGRRFYYGQESAIAAPPSDRLFLTVTDLVMQAGPVNLAIQRTLQQGQSEQGLLGARWRLNWESHLFRVGPLVLIDEAASMFSFSQDGTDHEYKGVSGERLVFNENGVAFRTKTDGTKETFDEQGRLIERDYRNGNIVKLHYSADGRLSRIEGPRGSYIKLNTGADGHLNLIETSTGSKVQYTYEEDGLTEVRTNNGPALRYAYDATGKLTLIDDPQSGPVEFAYDQRGRIITRQWADGSQEFREYDDSTNSYRIIDPCGGVTEIRRSQDGRQEEVIDSVGNKTVIEYNKNFRPVAITGPTGSTARYTYDALGRTIATETCCGNVTRFEYLDDSQLVKRITYADNTHQDLEYDANRNLIAIKEGAETVTAFTYYPDRLLRTVKGSRSPAREFTYYPKGYLRSETNALGETTQFEYDQRENLIRKTDPMGGVTMWSYNEQDWVVSVTDPAGATTSYAYDSRGRLVKQTDPSGSVTSYEYNAQGRLVAQTDPVGQTTRYQYDPLGRLKSSTDPSDHTYHYQYDAAGRLISETNPLGGVIKRSYDALGRILELIDASGGKTCYEYTDSGDLARIIGPMGEVTEYNYDSLGRRDAVIDPAGRTTRYERDHRGRVTKIVFPGGISRTYAYDKAGNLVREADNRREDIQYEYDALGRITRAQAVTGLETSYRYDALGNLVGLQDNHGGSLTMQYDGLGRLTSIRGPLGAASTYRYDLSGRILEVINPVGHTKRMTYTPTGDLAQVKEPSGDTTKYAYDPSGALTGIRHPGGGVTQLAYDPMGNCVEVTNPLGAKTRSVYDEAGRLVSSTDRKGQTTTYTYDPTGRLSEKRLADGKVVKYRYDAVGNLVEVDDGPFPVQYAYNSGGLLTQIGYPAIKRTLRYEYDEARLLSEFTNSEGRTMHYEYDAHKRLSAIQLPDGQPITFRYDAKDRLIGIAYTNGVRGVKKYDAADRIADISYTDRTGKTIAGWAYTYDAAGNLVKTVSSDASITRYLYDPAGRLIEEDGAAGRIEYGYLPGGNRAKKVSQGKTILYKYNNADQLVKTGDEIFNYDTNGNLVERKSPGGVKRYNYDAENRLVKVTLQDGKEISYGYAPTGERIWRKDASGLTHFVTDGTNLLAELDENLKPKASFLHGPGIDRPLIMFRDGNMYFYHAKALGSIAVLTESKGEIAVSYNTDAFGNLVTVEGKVGNPFIFTGREYEPDTGLYFYRARFYDPALGRFVSPDPIWAADDPKSMNSYAYCRNAPTLFTDPQGLQGETYSHYWEHLRGVTHEDILQLRREAELHLGQTRPETTQDLRWYQRQAAENVQRALVEAGKGGRQATTEYVRGRVRGEIGSPYEEMLRLQQALDQNARGRMAAEQGRMAGRPTRAAPRPTSAGAQQSGSPVGGETRIRGEMPAGRGQGALSRPSGGTPSGSTTGRPPSGTPPKPSGPGFFSTDLSLVSGTRVMGGLGIASLGINYWACREEGKSHTDCAKEILCGVAVGALILSPLITGGAVVGALAGVGAAAGGAAVVTVTAPVFVLLGADAVVDRAGNALANRPAVEAEQNLQAMQEQLRQKFDEFANHVKGEVAELNKLKSEGTLACREAKRLALNAEAGAQSAQAHKDALNGLIPAINEALASRPCDAVPGLKAGIDAATGSNFKECEDKVVRGIEWAKSAAANCDDADTADKIDEMYKSCKVLAAQIAKRAGEARAKNEELKQIKAKVNTTSSALAIANQITEKIGAEVTKVQGFSTSFITHYELAKAKKAQFDSKRASLSRTLSVLRGLFPSDPHVLVKKDEPMFGKFASLRESVNSISAVWECSPANLDAGEVVKSNRACENLFGEAQDLIPSVEDAALACGDVDTKDDAVQEMEASANYALLVVAGADDLPQKVAECRQRCSDGIVVADQGDDEDRNGTDEQDRDRDYDRDEDGDEDVGDTVGGGAVSGVGDPQAGEEGDRFTGASGATYQLLNGEWVEVSPPPGSPPRVSITDLYDRFNQREEQRVIPRHDVKPFYSDSGDKHDAGDSHEQKMQYLDKLEQWAQGGDRRHADTSPGGTPARPPTSPGSTTTTPPSSGGGTTGGGSVSEPVSAGTKREETLNYLIKVRRSYKYVQGPTCVGSTYRFITCKPSELPGKLKKMEADERRAVENPNIESVLSVSVTKHSEWKHPNEAPQGVPKNHNKWVCQ